MTTWLPDSIQADVRFALPAAVLVFAFTTTTSLLRGLLEGLQRYDITSKITISVSILRTVLLIAIVLVGGRLRELVVAEVIMSAVGFGACALAARRRVPGFKFLARPHASSLRELISFGSKLEIGHVAYLVARHFDKLLLSAFLGLEAVAYYDVGARLASVVKELPLELVSATLPVASTLNAAGKHEQLWRFYERGTRALAWTGLPFFCGPGVGAGPLLFVWAEVRALEAQLTVWILCTGMFLSVYSGMAKSVAVGIGNPETEMYSSLIAGVLNVVLSVVLLLLLGFAGAPLGTTIVFAAGSVYLMASLHTHFGHSTYLLVRPLIGPLLTAVPAGFIAWFIIGLAGDSFLGNVIGLVGSALAVGLIFMGTGMRAGVFTREFLRSVRNPG